MKKSERELKQYEKEQVYQIKQIEDQLSEMKFAGTEFEEQYSDFRELVRKFRTPRQRESILNGDIDNIKKVLEGKISPREIDDIFHSTDMNENDVLYMFREELQKSKKTKEEILKQALIDAYNAGYIDAQVNHINDAETYANELMYAKRTITMMYDGEVMTRYERMKNDPDYTDPPYHQINTEGRV